MPPRRPQLESSRAGGRPQSATRVAPHALAHGSRHNHFQRSPHSSRPTHAHHRPYSAVLSQQEPKVPLHAQPSRPTLDIIVLLPARCSPIHLRFATASYPAPGQQHAPKCDLPNSATLMCEPRSGPISPSILAFNSPRSGPISPMDETRPRYPCSRDANHAFHSRLPFTPSIHAFPFEKDHVASDRSGWLRPLLTTPY